MTTLQCTRRPIASPRVAETKLRNDACETPEVSAAQVRSMLHDIAFVLHATRVVKRMAPAIDSDND